MENVSNQLPGFYVEGKYYGTKFAQAAGRAQFLAMEHKRNIDVWFVDHLGVEDRKLTVVAKRPHPQPLLHGSHTAFTRCESPYASSSLRAATCS